MVAVKNRISNAELKLKTEHAVQLNSEHAVKI